MKMTKEVFEARLLQIQLERDAINASIMIMHDQNGLRINDNNSLAYREQDFNEASEQLRALQGDIKKLIDEYQAGQSPAPGLISIDDARKLILDARMNGVSSGTSEEKFDEFLRWMRANGLYDKNFKFDFEQRVAGK